MVTHRLAALAIADRVLLLGDGRIEYDGTPGQVVAFTRSRQPPSGPMRPHLAPV